MKKYFLIVMILFANTSNAQEKIEDISVGNGVIRTLETRRVIARFTKNNSGDTVTINMTEYFPFKKALPEIARKMSVEKGKTTYIRVKDPTNTITYQELSIFVPNSKQDPDSTINNSISFNYAIGRHTDQFGVKINYINHYALDFQIGTSIYRGDLNQHFLYFGLCNEFNSIYGSDWAGSFSAGAIGISYFDTDELTFGAVGIITLSKKFAKNSFFGPKLIFGKHNELGFSISTRF